MTPSDTPRTDAEELWTCGCDKAFKAVFSDFARQLERELNAAKAESKSAYQAGHAAAMRQIEIIDSLDLFPASELEVLLCKLPSGEIVIIFEDCTGKPPVIYKWCLDMANEWLAEKM